MEYLEPLNPHTHTFELFYPRLSVLLHDSGVREAVLHPLEGSHFIVFLAESRVSTLTEDIGINMLKPRSCRVGTAVQSVYYSTAAVVMETTLVVSQMEDLWASVCGDHIIGRYRYLSHSPSHYSRKSSTYAVKPSRTWSIGTLKTAEMGGPRHRGSQWTQTFAPDRDLRN
jgi:hypothetical protein